MKTGGFPIEINQRNRNSNFVVNLIIVILALFLVFFSAFHLLYERIYVVGASMESTLTGALSADVAGGDYVYICSYIRPNYGDIVVVDVGEKYLIKRVVALGGDRIELKNGVLYRNGKLVPEPYLDEENNHADNPANTFSELTVGEGLMFCMGDNRDESNDSRGDYGCMPISAVKGVVVGWSLQCKKAITEWNTFIDFTLSGKTEKK